MQPHFNYWCYVVIMMIGLWALIAKKNLIKKLIGMSIFQTAIILFYVSIGVKGDATIPIVDHHGEHHAHEKVEVPKETEHGSAGEEKHSPKEGKHHYHAKPEADDFVNPLPHVLMLTAIVVGVATLGVALAVAQSIYREFGTLEESEILAKIKASDYHD